MKFCLVWLFLAFGIVYAQDSYPTSYFQSPVDFPIYLSGTFGEPRSTHFHAGIDIKTQGVEGKEIKAAADGYVSRIKVSPWGYGNALYIKHPNGYTTVYGHLQSFKTEIAEWVKKKQLEKRSFSIDMAGLSSTLFEVKQGDVIGLSGNSGSSGGPHLHFEIRDEKEHIINPLHFGFHEMVKDHIAPAIHNMVLYNQSEDKYFTTSKTKKATREKENIYTIGNIISTNRKKIGVGIHSYDQMTGISNKNGVYAVQLFFDDSLIYHYEMNTFSFPEGRFTLSQTDYSMRKQHNRTVYKCYKEPGNRLSTLQHVVNDGIISLEDSLVHSVSVVIQDFHGNASTCTFSIQYDSSSTLFEQKKETDYQKILSQGQSNSFKTEGLSLYFSKQVLFDDLYFCFRKESDEDNTEIFCVHEQTTPLFTYFDIQIKPLEIDSSLIEKYLIAYKDEKNRTISLGGTFDNGFIHSKSRSFGHFFVTTDTIPPTIKPINIYDGKKMSAASDIRFKITDNLSGVDQYNAFLNGEWVVLAYDGKSATFTYSIDEFTLPGANTLVVVAADDRKNSSTYSIDFTY